MRSKFRRLELFLVPAFLFTCAVHADEPVKASAQQPAAEAAPSKQEQEVRDRMKGLADAYNQADPKKVAAFWSETAHYTAADGSQLKGRDQIEKYFAKSLAANKGIKIEAYSAKFRFVTADVALGEGTLRTSRPGESAESNGILSVHVKKDGDWYLDSVHETAITTTPSHYDNLKELEWFIGNWVDADENSTIEHKVEWVKNRNFIIDSFIVSVDGVADMHGMQVIGWDPSANTIRSWFFDSDGGFGEGLWTKNGKRWTVKANGVAPDGRLGKATHVYTAVDKDTYLWKSIGRKIGNDFMPNIEEVKVVRRPEKK